MNTTHSYDLVIGLDRSDRTASLHLVITGTREHREAVIDPRRRWPQPAAGDVIGPDPQRSSFTTPDRRGRQLTGWLIKNLSSNTENISAQP
jgi:hypothetical protein